MAGGIQSRWGGAKGSIHVGVDVTRYEAIGIHVVGGPLICEGLDELVDAALGIHVGRHSQSALVGEE